MANNILKFSFFVPTYIYGGACKNIYVKTQGGEEGNPVEELKKELEGLNIDDNDIISFSDFISSGAKFDSNKTKVKFDNNAVVNVTKFADKFKEKIGDLGPENVCDIKIEEKLRVFIDRIIECLKTKLNNGYKLDDNTLQEIYIVVEFKSEANNIVSESTKYIGNLQNNMSNFFKKRSNVYILSNFIKLPFDKEKGIYSSDTYNKKKNEKEKGHYLFECQFLFKDKTNKEAKIDALNEKAGSNDYYAVVNLKDYKNYYVCLKK